MTIKKPDIIPLILILGIAAYILYVTFFTGTFLTPDSVSYLRQAETLLSGNGFNYDAQAGARSYFAVWPVGYPALIAATSFLTGGDVALASKILSILILILIMVLFKRRFGESSPFISLLVFNLAFLRIFSYPLSEQPFLLGLIWFSFALYDFFAAAKPSFLASANLWASGLFLFLIRYSGVFAVFVPGLLALGLFMRRIIHRDPRRSPSLFPAVAAVTALQAAVVAFYLYQNQIHTGYLTGMPRIPPADPFSAIFLSLVRVELNELAAAAMAILLAVIIIGFRGLKGLLRIKPALAYFSNTRRPGFYIAGVAILYWLFVVLVRFTSQLDAFGYRLLHPATLLISIALFSYVLEQRKSVILSRLEKSRILYGVFVLLLAILCLALGVKSWRGKAPSFTASHIQNERRTVDKYKNLPSGSLVILGDEMARYLRPDLIFEYPKFSPYHRIETITRFFERCRAYKPDVRIFLNNGAISERFFTAKYPVFDESVYRYFRELKKNEGDFTEIPAK